MMTFKQHRVKNLGFGAGATVFAVLLFAGIAQWAPIPSAAAPPPVPWTAVASTGAADESAFGIFAFSGPSVGYGAVATSTAPIEFRYNVTNTGDTASSTPGWKTLEVGMFAPATSVVSASLYQVERCTGKQTLLCSVRGTNFTGTTGQCRTCTLQTTANPIDFARYLYYVDLFLDRNTPGEKPLAHTLRLF